METEFPNSITLLNKAVDHLLYKQLLSQLNKDLKLAGISMDIPDNPEPKVLVDMLREKIYRLLMEDFSKYLNLLYISDVPERELLNTRSSDAVDSADMASFLLLKRIWKKVWIRDRLS